jgi:hypothetical protein
MSAWSSYALGARDFVVEQQSQSPQLQQSLGSFFTQAPVSFTPEQVQMLYRQLYAISYASYRRPRHPEPPTNFGAYEQAHRAINQDPSEESEDMEGFTGMLNTFLVGCDPEFVAIDSAGKQINLANYIRPEGEVGYDHGGRVGEFRPEPTKGTFALTKRLQRLIKSAPIEKLNANKLRAGARINRDVLGGHVHFGFPVSRSTPAQVAALDRVTQVLEGLDILPANESKLRRGGEHYGRFGDIRDSNGHIEYRTMASWLTDPKVAYLCLTAAKLAACDPAGTTTNLKTAVSFDNLIEWFRAYRTKDVNARRAVERVLSLGHKALQVYPDVDFRERWRVLGL